MITERTLRNWRRDALSKNYDGVVRNDPESVNTIVLYLQELNERILRLTQELLDNHLMKGK
jgi:hypothetical protein